MNSKDGGQIKIGWAGKDITPDLPVNLQGQYDMRISKGVQDPLTLTALAVSAGSPRSDAVVFVSCDRAGIPCSIIERCRAAIRAKLPELDPLKIVMNATHTHTASDITGEWYPPVPEGVMTPSAYGDFFVERVVEAVIEAWQVRKPGGVSWGLGTAVVGHNRRTTYFQDIGAREKAQLIGKFADGVTKMYGNTNDPLFSHMEGYEDHYVDLMYTWDQNRCLTGVIINLACPSQETEGDVYVSADFWHEVRTEIRKRHGQAIQILAQCAPAGDQSPHRMWYQAAEDRMLRLRGLSMRQEIGRRLANAVDDVLPLAGKDIRDSLVFRHVVKNINLPKRIISEAEAAEVRDELAKLEAAEAAAPEKNRMFSSIYRCKEALERYTLQKKQPQARMELHVIRIGDTAFASNPFELFLDFGVRMRARSPAEQTFLIQLSHGKGSYLPTARAVAGKSYGAGVYDNEIGPEGGQLLVEETLGVLKELWSNDQRST